MLLIVTASEARFISLRERQTDLTDILRAWPERIEHEVRVGVAEFANSRHLRTVVLDLGRQSVHSGQLRHAFHHLGR